MRRNEVAELGLEIVQRVLRNETLGQGSGEEGRTGAAQAGEQLDWWAGKRAGEKRLVSFLG